MVVLHSPALLCHTGLIITGTCDICSCCYCCCYTHYSPWGEKKYSTLRDYLRIDP
jgi:hypothetical protein